MHDVDGTMAADVDSRVRRGEDWLGRVLVLGLGVSGKAVARYCAGLLGSRISEVFIAAGAESEDSLAFLNEIDRDGVSWAFGDDALESASGSFDLCIASPGIPFWHDLYVGAERLSAAVISEVEFSWLESAPDSVWVAITGTNGKTTTTSLAAHILKECGFAADAVGNIGDVCLNAVAAGRTRVYVAEVSSYQLYSTKRFAPDVALELNITPDHVHWHRTLEAYRDAKFTLLDHMAQAKAPHAVAILDATNDVVRAKVRELRQLGDEQRGFDYIPLGTADGIQGDMRARCGARNAAFIDGQGTLVVAYQGVEHRVGNTSQLQIKGLHNASNALAAAAIAVVLAADDERVASAIAGFEPLEHRIEPCGEVHGVHCYNDSKATNVDATVKALEAFPGRRVVVLLGGDDKGTDLSELADAVHRLTHAAVCFGEAGPRIAEAIQSGGDARESGFVLERAAHLEDALDAALGLAEPGDVLLLSPACASFDEFTSFEHRGSVFKQLVAARMRG